jgi:DNA-directed RNA polymerase subunit alpha
MTIDLTGLVRPHVVEMAKRDDNPFAAEFRLQPLERGFGHTLGNALRRMLLSSLRGTAIWGFRLEGVVHEHQTVPSVVEDIHQIIQRLKSLTIVLAEDVDEAVLHLKASKAGPVLARDIERHGAVSVVHPDQVLFTLQEDREITGELYVNKGRGYVEASQHPSDRSLPVDLVKIDAMYSPVLRANFTVAETRVGQRTDFDSVNVAVETNGAISPEDAVAYAAALLQEHLRYFIDFGRVPDAPDDGEGDSADNAQLRDLLAKPIDDCGLSVRSINSLKNSSISTLADLVRYSEDDMLKVKNVGEKALKEIAEMLHREGLSFGMSVDESQNEMVGSAASPVATTEPGQGEESLERCGIGRGDVSSVVLPVTGGLCCETWRHRCFSMSGW